MTQPPSSTIELSICIAAPREVVFRFFSDPGRYKLWMGEQSTMKSGSGGRLTVSFGPGPTAIGTILEWREPEQIVFDWSHEGEHAAASRVTVTLRETTEGTLVTLKHEGIVERTEREGTASGWRYYLSALGGAVLAERLSSIAPQAIQTYLSAWAEPEPAKRATILAGSVANEVRFRDRYGAIDGRDNLSQYIGGVQKMMGPARLEPQGPLDRVQAFFRQNWKVAGPDGQTLFHGQNFYEFDGQAKLALIVGFWS